jgi:preprotein translocase subunit SecD
VGVKRIERRGAAELVVELASAQAWSTAQTAAGELTAFEIKEPDQAAGRFVLAMRPKDISQLKELAVRQGLETIRNRVDQFGVAEPSIQQQGTIASSSSSRACRIPSERRRSSARPRCSSSS